MKGVLEHVASILKEAEGALDIATLCQELVKRRILQDTEQKTRHHLYTQIFMSIRNNGENSRFRKVGRGSFALAEHVTESGEVQLGKGIRATGFGGERRCGNCNFISYSGVQELHMFGGYCEAENSNRDYVQRDSESCPYWRQRPPDKVAHDKRRREELRVKIHIANLKMRGRRVRI